MITLDGGLSIFSMKNREALSKLKAYIIDMKGLLGNTYYIRRLHSDGGGEFMSDEFKLYCKNEEGILTTSSAPRTPEQNGLARRTH